MLRASAAQGVDEIVATPHYYADRESPEVFLRRRHRAFEELRPYLLREAKLPRVYLGAEVRYFEGMSHVDQIVDLTIANTQLMLVEMPFRAWSQRMIQELSVLQRHRGIRPILAHIERYPCFRNTNLLRQLCESGMLLQMNAEVLFSYFPRMRAEKLIKDGIIEFLATDCHNMTSRKPNLNDGFNVLRTRCGENFVNQWLVHGNKIIGR